MLLFSVCRSPSRNTNLRRALPVRNVVQDLMTPEEPAAWHKPFTMPQIRSAAEPEQKLHEYGKAKPTGWNSIQPVGFVVLAN